MEEVPEIVVTTPTETIEIPAAPKTRKTSTLPLTAKARTLDALDKIEPKKMTPAEAALYINACREALMMQGKKIEELEKTCQKAFEQFRNADQAYKNCKTEADTKLTFIQKAIEVCYESVKMQGGTH